MKLTMRPDNIKLTDLKEGMDQLRTGLVEDGWCQGTFTNFEGAHCLTGALSFYVVQGDVADELTELLMKQVPVEDNIDLVDWNDKRARKVEEVYELLDKTEAALK